MVVVNPGTAIKKYVDAQKTKVTVTPALTSGTKIASISVDGVSKDLYCVKDTDTKVTQTHSTANGSYPILLKDGTGTGTVTNGALFDGDVSVNPSTGKITAKAFVGALEGTATKATQDGNGKVIADTYATKAVATASADGLMSKTDKANMAYVHRYAVVGQNSNIATKKWFKVAELKGKTAAHWDPFISFYVWEGYTTTSHGGILTIHFRTGVNGAVEGYEFYWQLASKNVVYDSFVVAYDPDATSTTYELWYQSDSWDIKKFEVLAEGDRNNSYALWTLFQNVASDGDGTAPTSGYTQLKSIILDIRNRSTLAEYADSAGKATNDDAGRHIPSYYWRIDDDALGDAYTMTKADWNGSVPIRKRVMTFKTASESPDGQNIGDYYLYNLGHVDPAGYATILAVSPRIDDRLFTGHFWNGVWQGWKEISLSRDTVKDLSINGKTITVTKGDGTTSTLTTQDTVPSVGNATLTIQKNGASAGTFTANATANKIINIAVPTKVSELTNDSDYAKKTEAVGSVTRDSADPHKIVIRSISTAFENSFTTADTLNTAGSTNLFDTKLYLVGAQSQAAGPQTYSNKNCYVDGNSLYSNGSEVYTKGNLKQATINSLGLMSGTHVAKLSSIEEGANRYILPAATADTLGGIKVGSGLTINGAGVLSSTASSGVGKNTYPSWIFTNPSDTIYFKNTWDVPYVFCVHYDGSKSGTTYISVYGNLTASGDILFETSTSGAGARSAWGLVPPNHSARGRSGAGSLSNGTVYAYPVISAIAIKGKQLPSNGPFWQ